MALCQSLQVPSSTHAATKKVPQEGQRTGRSEERTDVIWEKDRINMTKRTKNTTKQILVRRDIREEVDKLAEEAPRSENIT